MKKTRRIRIDALTRVEGEGALNISLRRGKIDEVQLNIYEPPRFFEAFLRGRAIEEVPDITARICGICPVAYQMSAVHALEAALGVQITPEIRRLRRLLYCGEWIESHALHMHLLHAPDFLGYESGIAMADKYHDEVTRGLRIKKYGNELIEVLGGRAIHPINVAVGGFYRYPRQEELAALIPNFEWGLQACIAATRWVATFDFPDFTRPYQMVALVHPDEYAMNEGRVVTTTGQTIAANDFERDFEEFQVAHSTALQSRRIATRKCYFVGPLARINLSRQLLSESARRLADEIGLEFPCLNPHKSIIVRGLELVHAFETALEILGDYRPCRVPRVTYAYREAEGCAATEAPRGLLYHRYAIDAQGHVTLAKIVPPTSQNQAQIEDDLATLLPNLLDQQDEQIALRCETLIRSYDPCISCSTHFLKLHWQRK